MLYCFPIQTFPGSNHILSACPLPPCVIPFRCKWSSLLHRYAVAHLVWHSHPYIMRLWLAFHMPMLLAPFFERHHIIMGWLLLAQFWQLFLTKGWNCSSQEIQILLELLLGQFGYRAVSAFQAAFFLWLRYAPFSQVICLWAVKHSYGKQTFQSLGPLHLLSLHSIVKHREIVFTQM